MSDVRSKSVGYQNQKIKLCSCPGSNPASSCQHNLKNSTERLKCSEILEKSEVIQISCLTPRREPFSYLFVFQLKAFMPHQSRAMHTYFSHLALAEEQWHSKVFESLLTRRSRVRSRAGAHSNCCSPLMMNIFLRVS